MSANVEALWREIVQLKRELARLKVGPEVFGVGWTDYSTSSTIVGWSSFTTKEIYYCTMPIAGGNKLVFVFFNLAGPSDNTSVSFTVPFSNAGSNIGAVLEVTRDNGTLLTSPGRFRLAVATVLCWTDTSTGGWTASGTKEVRSEFWYVG